MCLRMPPMPTRLILIRAAVALVLMAVLVVLADSVARHELRQATGDTTVAAAVVQQPAGTSDDE